jgi:tetratricopeptide (TPR) repeat protein
MRKRNAWKYSLIALLAWSPALHAQTGERRARIDVQAYRLVADVNLRTQSINAVAAIRFVSLEDRNNSVTFELNNALNVSKVVNEKGEPISASRNQDDFTIRLTYPENLPKDQPQTVMFYYDGKLTGQEESPVYGIRFAAIQNEYAYLLYPSRWFPISGYTTDRFTMEMRVTVAPGERVLASGLETKEETGGKVAYQFQFDKPGFPGSIAVVKGEPTRVSSAGVTTFVYFRGAEQALAQSYGEETGKVVAHFAAKYGTPPYANLTLIQTEAGAANGYAAPGLLFLSPRGIGQQPNLRLLANQVSRQWWGLQVSPVTRNHLWLANGLASYAEALYQEQINGPEALEREMRDAQVEALTIENIPQSQAGRLEDYSPELNALSGAKGAVTAHMLRYVIGDEAFFEGLKNFAASKAGQSASTDDFRRAMELSAKQDLGYFFIQWVESSGAPEFKLEYTIFRTQKGFRAVGKVSQDLDTFRMPVDLRIETEGNPEEARIEVVGTSSEFSVDTFGKPRKVILDPNNKVLRFSNQMRIAVAIRRGEQFAEISEFGEALKEYQKALEVNRASSLAHYRIAEVFFLQNNYQSAANEFREALNGDLQPPWTEVWSHINLGKIFDITGQRERAVNEYKQALRTKDNTQGALEEANKYLAKPYEREKRQY